MNSDHRLTRKRFTEITSSFRNKRLLVLGDVGVDRYTVGEATRLNAEAPVPIVSVESVTDKLGLSGNVADNVKAFGAEPWLATLVGNDRHGEELRALLQDKGIADNLVLGRDSRRTILKERVVANNQQVVRVDHETVGDVSAGDAAFLWEHLEARIADCDAVIIEDYAKGVMTEDLAQKTIKLARDHKKFVAVDPPSTSHRRHIARFKGANLVTPNLHEAEKLSGQEMRTAKQLEEAGLALQQEMDCEVMVITQGKDGMSLFPRGHERLQVPTFARSVFDVSGAGDTVVAMLTLAQVSGADLRESALLANFAAGCEVGKPGTATVALDELAAYIESIDGFSS